jgi:hypothetical protein
MLNNSHYQWLIHNLNLSHPYLCPPSPRFPTDSVKYYDSRNSLISFGTYNPLFLHSNPPFILSPNLDCVVHCYFYHSFANVLNSFYLPCLFYCSHLVKLITWSKQSSSSLFLYILKCDWKCFIFALSNSSPFIFSLLDDYFSFFPVSMMSILFREHTLCGELLHENLNWI